MGCSNCNSSGYRGRQAIFEMMLMNSEIRELAFNQASITDLRHAALNSGMRPLVSDGKLKILRGVTTPDEIARMAQVDADVSLASDEE